MRFLKRKIQHLRPLNALFKITAMFVRQTQKFQEIAGFQSPKQQSFEFTNTPAIVKVIGINYDEQPYLIDKLSVMGGTGAAARPEQEL
jgi:hypothetical protein